MKCLKILLLTGVISLVLVSALVDAVRNMASFKGWTEVDTRWPLNASEYFVATSKGHHFIDVKLPGPDKLTTDLMARIEFYFSFARVKPVLQVVPCKKNLDIIPIGNVLYGPRADRWETHEITIRREDCRIRSELAYNVLIHDAGDVFAWRLIQVRPPPQPQPILIQNDDHLYTTQQVDTTQRSKFDEYFGVTTRSPDAEATTSYYSYTTQPGTTQTPATESSIGTEVTDATSQWTTSKPFEATTEPVTTDIPTMRPEPTTMEPERTTRPPSPSTERTSSLVDPSPEGRRPSLPTRGPVSNGPRRPSNDQNAARTTFPPRTSSPRPRIRTTVSPPEATTYFNKLLDFAPSPVDPPPPSKPMRRLQKRQADISEIGDENEVSVDSTTASCTPRLCNRDQFSFARFDRVLKDLPQLPADALESGQRFYLNMDGKPLDVQLQTENDFAAVDTCIDMQLYMDPGTELQLLLKEQRNSKPSEKVLETLLRQEGDSAASHWDSFKRCLSEYMPKLQTSNDSEIHSLDLQFVPKTQGADKWVGMLIDPQRSVSTRMLYPMYDFLPNVVNFDETQQVANYWVMDRDGLRKPELTFVQDPRARSGKLLRISDIDEHQVSFDLTSRWLKINNLETVESPIFMMYRANRPDWIREIYFEFQRAGSDWISQRVYLKTPPEPTNTTSEPLRITNGSETNTLPPTQFQEPRSMHLLPIKMKGLDDRAFRLRVRHYLDREAASSSMVGNKELDISTLAFGDACAESSFCLNGGKCRPIGPSDAKCTCRQGYSGRHCQTVRPCDVLYGSQGTVKQTGRELCRSIGAQCVETLPVLRCKWPNDQYYQCHALFQEQPGVNGEETVVVPAAPAGSQNPGPNNSDSQPVDSSGNPIMPSPEQVAAMREQTQRQAKLIIVLSVFMAALMLFAVVLMASMISRLVKSKRRLKEVQIEVVELTRRSQPGPSSARTYGRPAQQRPANLSTYNNQAFDVE